MGLEFLDVIANQLKDTINSPETFSVSRSAIISRHYGNHGNRNAGSVPGLDRVKVLSFYRNVTSEMLDASLYVIHTFFSSFSSQNMWSPLLRKRQNHEGGRSLQLTPGFEPTALRPLHRSATKPRREYKFVR